MGEVGPPVIMSEEGPTVILSDAKDLLPRYFVNESRFFGSTALRRTGLALLATRGAAPPYPGPYNAIPGRAQVGRPPSRTITPLTRTRSKPRES
jgi:hypothetical protein